MESRNVEKNCLKKMHDKRRQLREILELLNPSHLAMLFLAPSVSSASHRLYILPNMPTFQNYPSFGLEVAAAARPHRV